MPNRNGQRSTRRLVAWVSRAVALVSLGAMAVAALMWTSAAPVPRSVLVQATHDGDRIISAVLRFRNERGTLPATVDDLSPAYLPTVPAAEFGVWRLAPASPGRTVNNEFALRLEITGPVRRWRTGHAAIVCYVEPGKRADWYAEPSRPGDSDARFLRSASMP